MKIAITGSTGLIGSALVNFFSKKGDQVTRIVRNPQHSSFNSSPSSTMIWSPEKKEINPRELAQQDVVIHLAGENIGAGRWSEKRKEDIKKSRIQGTSFLSEVLANLETKPKIFFSASAIGFYGNREDDLPLDENASSPKGFLAELCHQWEETTTPAIKAGIRVVHMRFGIVLSPEGGALSKMLPVFRLGLGGKIGNGKQMMSWISLNEIPKIIAFLMNRQDLSGPINFVAPQSVSNREFSRVLGAVLKRPSFLPVPAPAIKLLLGEMGNDLLLKGAAVAPSRLIEAGYHFSYPYLEEALKNLLNKSPER
jgi:uncharacterized protein (TIGR01777 family)